MLGGRGSLLLNPRMPKAAGSHLCHQVERTRQGLMSTPWKVKRKQGKKRKGGRERRKKGREKRWEGGKEEGIEEREEQGETERERENEGDGMVGGKEEGRSHR